MPEEKNIIKPNEFKCAYCGGVYGKKWSDEEAKEEMIDLWGYIPKDEQVIICDDCFQLMNPADNLNIARNCGYKK